jgi:hypothetical protein
VMYSPGERVITVSDMESIISQCTKSLESADQATRHSLSQLVGHILAITQTERPPAPAETSTKGKKNESNDDNEMVSTTHTTTESTTILTLAEMFSQLSTPFNKPHTSRKTRVGIFDFYIALLTKLGTSFVEANYAVIVNHLMTEIVGNPRNSTTRYETLLVRNLVGIILRELVGVRMLSEQGQIGAIQELSKSYLKRWPAMMPGQVAPSSLVLSVALREVASLLQQLGNAPPPVQVRSSASTILRFLFNRQDAVAEPLVALLAHPSHTVRVSASWALRCFCFSSPLRLPKTILIVMEMLQRDIGSLLSPAAPSDVNLRALGHAYGLSALMSIISERPLYVSYDISAKVFDMAVQLLKRAGEHDVKVAAVEVEVAWTSIASLMSLGPNFVRPHLPQLLVLWRNALPKPTSKDSAASSSRLPAEWTFLLHVRESALGAILCFLRHNSSALVTLDVGRRITSVLGNALLFANNFISQDVEDASETSAPAVVKGLSLRLREALLRRRVYQCFTALGFSSITESTQSTLLQSTVSLFASPDGYSGSSVQAAIASGTFISIWHSIDGYGYGVSSIDITDNDVIGSDGVASSTRKDQLNRDTVETSIDNLVGLVEFYDI